MGTHVVSSTATAVVTRTGKETEFGEVSERLKLRPPETEFERGIRHFGFLLMRWALLLVIVIFAANIYFERPVVDSFLFSLALAVGLTPQLLPAITSITLSYGAKRMTREKVIVRRLTSIEDFGSMNVLCSDKTGTLTEGTIRLRSAENLAGDEDCTVFLYAYLNAFYETGYLNLIDKAIRDHDQPDVSRTAICTELQEVFYRLRRASLHAIIADVM